MILIERHGAAKVVHDLGGDIQRGEAGYMESLVIAVDPNNKSASEGLSRAVVQDPFR